jgi:hypothetical protein
MWFAIFSLPVPAVVAGLEPLILRENRQVFYHCATRMSITTLCIITLGFKTLGMIDTASITTRLSINISVECLTKFCSVLYFDCYPECLIFIVVLSVVMLRAIILNIMLNIIMVSVVAVWSSLSQIKASPFCCIYTFCLIIKRD